MCLNSQTSQFCIKMSKASYTVLKVITQKYVSVQIAAHQCGHIAQRCLIQLIGTDLGRLHHLLGALIETEQHAGQIVAGNARTM